MAPDPVPAPSRRARALALGLLALVVLGSLPWTVHAWYDPTNDGSMYVATARALLAGEGYSYLGVPFLIRPPGFSCLIAPILALRGTDFHALNLAVSLSGAVGIVLFHLLLRERLGLVLATLVPLVLWFNPGYQQLCNQVMSDVPGWSLLVACFLLARRFEARMTVVHALALGAAIGLATYVRSGNLLLVPAFACAALARELPRSRARVGWRAAVSQVLALVFGAVLVLAPWSLRNRAVAPPPPADQTLLYSYASGMWHEDMGDPRSPRLPASAILARFPVRWAQIERDLGVRLREVQLEPWTRSLAWILLASLGLRLARRRTAEEFFALGTLLVVAFYFGYAVRLLLPILAFALAALVELLRAGLTRLAGARAGTGGAVLFCVAWLVLDWHPREGWERIRELHEAHVENARLVNQGLPPGARLGTWRGWHHSVYLERPVWSFENAYRRTGTPAALEGIIDKYALEYVMLTPLGLPDHVRLKARELAAHIARRYGDPDRSLVKVR